MAIQQHRARILQILYEARARGPLQALDLEDLAQQVDIPLAEIRPEVTYLEEKGYVVSRERQIRTRIFRILQITAKGVELVEGRITDEAVEVSAPASKGPGMRLAGDQVAKIKEALLSAFPSRHSLAEMVRVQLDESLEEIAGGENLRQIVFSLISWAEATGRDKELITKAHEHNPGNELLKALFDDLRLDPEARDANNGSPD